MTPHGTVSTYSNHGCKCDECRAAWVAYCKEKREDRARALAGGSRTRGKRGAAPKNAGLIPHGVESTYLNWSCRCDACKAEHARRERDRAQARKARAS